MVDGKEATMLIPKTLGGAFRRVGFLFMLVATTCVRNIWLVRDLPDEPPITNDPLVYTVLKLSRETANWPCVGLFFVLAATLVSIGLRFDRPRNRGTSDKPHGA
jgi:hypothetical protein